MSVIHPHIPNEYDFRIIKAEKVKSVIKVTTRLGIFAIKKSQVSHHQAKRMNEILHFLKEQQFPAAPMIPNKFGDLLVPVKDGNIYVTKWADGEPLKLNMNNHLLKMVEVMAQMHKIGLEFQPRSMTYQHHLDEMFIRRNWEERIDQLKKYYKLLKRKGSNSTFEYLFLTYYPFLKDWSEEAVERLSEWVIQYHSTDSLRKTISHGRIHHRNALIMPDGEVLLLDFDHVRIDTPVRDLAYFIRNYISNKENRKWTSIWVKSYENILPLAASEKKLLASYLLFPDKMMTLVRHYEQKEKDWPEEEYTRKLQIRWEQMKEMIWFIDQSQWLS